MGFADGFAAGSSAVARGLGMREAREQRERENAWRDEVQMQQRTQWQRENQRAAEVDQAFRDYGTLSKDGHFEGATGLQQPSMQQLASGGTAYGSGEQAIRDATGDYAREAARMGTGETYNPTAGITKRAASPLELERSMGRISAAQRDVRGMRESAVNARKLEEDEIFSKAEVNEDTVKFMNQNHNSITIGDADKKGFRQLSFVKLDGRAAFERLSAADQKKLAGAQALYERNPERALKIIAEVNGDLAKVIAAENQQGEAVVRAGNDVAGRSHAASHQDAVLRETGRHNRAVEGITAARANRENVAMARLEQGDALGREAAGYAEGLARARSLGTAGKEAADIYSAQLAGTHERMRGLGLNPGNDRMRMSPKDEMAARAQLKTAGYNDQQIEAMVTGYDPVARMAELLQARGGAPAQPGANGGVRMPLKNPTLSQLQAMSPEAVARYAEAGSPIARAMLRDQRRDAAPAEPVPAGYGQF
jgi:hypothetical protein